MTLEQEISPLNCFSTRMFPLQTKQVWVNVCCRVVSKPGIARVHEVVRKVDISVFCRSNQQPGQCSVVLFQQRAAKQKITVLFCCVLRKIKSEIFI